MDILTKRTVLDKIPEQLSDLAKEYSLEQVELIQKGSVIPERELEIDVEERTVVKYVSTISVDRDGDIVLPDGGQIKDFQKNPVILYAHKHGADMFGGGNDTLPIGKDIWIKADKFGIKAKQKYANHQLADDIFNMHKDGFALASSIGFIPLEYVRNDGSKEWSDTAKYVKDKYGMSTKDLKSAKIIFTKWYLLEHSDVPVPSNPDALAQAYSSGEFKCKSLNLAQDLDLEKQKEAFTIKELENSLEIECDKTKELEKEKTVLQNFIDLEKNNVKQLEERLVDDALDSNKLISELEHTIKEKDAEIKRIKAEKPKFSKEQAESLIKLRLKEVTDHIRKKFGEV